MPWFDVLTELTVYVLAVLCLRHAWKTGGTAWTATYVCGAIYGFALEYLSVRQHDQYCYGKFLLMLPPWGCPEPGPPPCPCPDQVPLWIFLGWGVTLYVAMQTSSRLRIPWKVRPLVDALLAVNIDWILDPLSSHLGWWHWMHPGPWFGIPLYNYFGWIVTVAGFSFVVRGLRHRFLRGSDSWKRTIGFPLIAMGVGPLLVFLALQGYWALATVVAEELIVGSLVALLLVATVYQMIRVRGDQPIDRLLIFVAVFFQLYYSVGLYLSGAYSEHPMLALVFAGTVSLAAAGYSWPYRLGRTR